MSKVVVGLSIITCAALNNELVTLGFLLVGMSLFLVKVMEQF